ncbi:MAG: exopolysaccharide biosynthesis protein [Geminicoccaceae bacterium]
MSEDGDDTLAGLIGRLQDKAGQGDQITVGEVVAATGSRSIGPLLFVPALLAISPVGAIPGMSIIFSAVIILLAVQTLFAGDHLWLPSFVNDRQIPSDKLRSALEWLKPYAERVDRVLGNRLTFLVNTVAIYTVAALCILLALTMIPLAALPFAVALPSGAILLFSIGLVTRDGLVIAIGGLVAATAIYLTVTALL